jgi:hypothetical protein
MQVVRREKQDIRIFASLDCVDSGQADNDTQPLPRADRKGLLILVRAKHGRDIIGRDKQS